MSDGGKRKPTDRIGRIDDDHVKVVLLFLHIQGSVHEQLGMNRRSDGYKLHTRIIESNRSAVCEVLLRHVNDLLVDLAHHDVLHFRMLRHFTQNATITASHNQNLSLMFIQ